MTGNICSDVCYVYNLFTGSNYRIQRCACCSRVVFNKEYGVDNITYQTLGRMNLSVQSFRRHCSTPLRRDRTQFLNEIFFVTNTRMSFAFLSFKSINTLFYRSTITEKVKWNNTKSCRHTNNRSWIFNYILSLIVVYCRVLHDRRKCYE